MKTKTKKLFGIIISTLLSFSMITGALSLQSLALDSVVTSEKNLYSTSDWKSINAETKTKDEAIVESKQLYPTLTRAPRTTLPNSATNALDIPASNNMPYYISSYTLTAGSAGYAKITFSSTYNLSVFTAGSTDTYLEIYSDLACNNLIASNDDSGNGTNACVLFYGSKGTTYYIRVRGYNTSTNGGYQFVVQRGLPTSLYEKSDMFSIYNSKTYQNFNNCYTYALTYYKNPSSGQLFRYNGQVPGELSGNPIVMSAISNASEAKTAFENAFSADFSTFGGKWKEIGATEQPDAGYFKVALFIEPNFDFHFYRQIPQGNWAHKPGSTVARISDSSNNYIYIPTSCNRYTSVNCDYDTFVGYYEFNIPTTVVAAQYIPQSTDVNLSQYKVKNDIVMNDILSLTTNSTIKETLALLGLPQRRIGSGFIGDVYKLKTGEEVTVYYIGNTIDLIREYHNDGSFDVIVK
jgi:hypothetical protein